MKKVTLPVAIVLFLIGAAGFVAPRVVAPILKQKIEATAEKRLGRKLLVGNVRLRLGLIELVAVAIEGLGSEPPFVAPLVRVRFSPLSLLGKTVEVTTVEVVQPRIDLRHSGSDDNFTSMLQRLKTPSEPSDATPSGRRVHLGTLSVSGATVEIADEDRGSAHVGHLDATLPEEGTAIVELRDVTLSLPGGIRASLAEASLAAPVSKRKPSAVPSLLIKSGTLTPFRGLELTGIEGTIAAPDRQAKEAKIDVRGSYGGSTTPLWEAHGTIADDLSSASVELVAQRFKLSQLDALYKRKDGGPQILNASDGEADGRFAVNYANRKIAFAGNFHLAGLDIAHPMLAPVPIPRLGFDARTRGTADLDQRHLVLEELKIDYRNVHATLAADIERVGKKPRFKATLKIAPLPCQTALTAIPAELVPNLQGFQLQGTFTTDLHAAIDFDNLDEPVDLGGLVGIEGCKVVKAPEFSSIARLQGTFEQTVETEPGKWLTFYAGPENPDFAPYPDISQHLVNSIMTTEDSGFFKHHGFIFSEFRGALRENLRRGYFRLGASSISMQMVKNVLLSREKTLSRKLQELFLTWYLERHLSKERILEIYFNVIEFGPGIYGIGRAARHYFGKSAKELQPQEAAFFSSILPSPKRRYTHFCSASGQLEPKWSNYVRRILKRMHERGRLTKDEFDRASAATVKFDRAEAMPEKDCLAWVKKITGPPPPKP